MLGVVGMKKASSHCKSPSEQLILPLVDGGVTSAPCATTAGLKRSANHGKVVFKPYQIDQIMLPMDVGLLVPPNHVSRV